MAVRLRWHLRRTILLSLMRNRVQSSPSPTQPRGRPVHSGIRILQQVMVQVQLRPDLYREVILPSNRAGQEVEPLILICRVSHRRLTS